MLFYIYFISSITILTMFIYADSTEVCPINISPCNCSGSGVFMSFICDDFENVYQVQNVLKEFPSPIEDLTIKHNSAQLPSNIFEEVCILALFLELPQLNISDSLFENQTECLRLLAIRGGIMEEIPINKLLPLKQLITLVFAENHITVLKEALWKLNIQHLVLDSNNMSRIHSDVFPRTLQSLSLVNNRLESLNGSLLFLTDLYWLFMSNNRITTLNGELSGLSNLENLTLRGNQIEILGDSLHSLSKLAGLDLSKNRINLLGNSFNGLDNLKKLNLSYNFLTELLDNDFQSLSNLKSLDLSHNQLNSLGRSLIHLKKLKNLNLAGNRLVEIGESFNCLNAVRTVDLSENLLENLNFMVDIDLDEEWNNCHFRESNQSIKFSLIGNPLQCTSNLISILLHLIEEK